MPYYWARAYTNYLSTVLELESTNVSTVIHGDAVRDFINDIIDWMDLKYGEDGDCEDEKNPKSKISSYNIHPPKESDQTKIGKWLRSYIHYDDVNLNFLSKQYNIYDYIADKNHIHTVEKLFHSLDVDDQLSFIENIPTLIEDLNEFYERNSDSTHEESDSESDRESDSESEADEEPVNHQSITRDSANSLQQYLGNVGFEKFIDYCEYVNNEERTTNEMFAYLTEEFGTDLELYWDDIILVAQSQLFGKLDEGYVADLVDIEEAPALNLSEEEEDSSEDEEEEEQDVLSDIDDLEDIDITPISLAENEGFIDNLDDIAVELSQVFQDEHEFAHLENNNNITTRTPARRTLVFRV